MIYRAMELLGVWPVVGVVKIGDTIADVDAGVNAPVWTVVVTHTGNMLGLTLAEFQGLGEVDLATRSAKAAEAMRDAGAHYVIDGFAQLPEVLDDIERRLAKGEGPGAPVEEQVCSE